MDFAMHQNSRYVDSYDVAVIGSGILGLASAWAAAKRGLRVALFEKDEQAQGASVRNFGFITLSGQDPEYIWPRANRSRQLWRLLCESSGIPIVQQGMLLLAQRPRAAQVLEEFLQTERGKDCRFLSRAEMRKTLPLGLTDHLAGMLYSPHEIRVESHQAIYRFRDCLTQDFNVGVYTSCEVLEIDGSTITTTQGRFKASHSVVCVGAESKGPIGGQVQSVGITRCQLQMLRLDSPGFTFPATIMSDLSLIRYGDFATQPSTPALKAQLQMELPELLANGIHLIVAQSSDKSLVVGDSHHYSDVADHISRPDIDELILSEYQRCFNTRIPEVQARWLGVYSSRAGNPIVLESPQPNVRVLAVTSGCGASIGLALGEEVLIDLLGH